MKAIEKVIREVHPHWVGDGFPVRSLFTYREANRYDPFLLLDYAGPYQFAPAAATRGVGEHPHRGFETVTIIYQGELEHRDSSGGRGAIGPGDVQWMTAAGGVVHEEFHSERFTRDGGVLEMVQLWVNLPARDKKAQPRYQDIAAATIPRVELPGGAGEGRVIAGEFLGTRGPAKTFTRLAVVDLRLQAGKTVTVPAAEGQTTLLVVQKGRLRFDASTEASGVSLVRFDRGGTDIQFAVEEEAMALLLCGEPIGEPVAAQGPFVMNTAEEIHQSIADYQSGRMGHLS